MATGKRLKFGGPGLTTGNHTWYEKIIPDENGELELKGDVVVKGKVEVVHFARPGDEADADELMLINNRIVGSQIIQTPDGPIQVPKQERYFTNLAESFVSRGMASYITGGSGSPPSPANTKPKP